MGDIFDALHRADASSSPPPRRAEDDRPNLVHPPAPDPGDLDAADDRAPNTPPTFDQLEPFEPPSTSNQTQTPPSSSSSPEMSSPADSGSDRAGRILAAAKLYDDRLVVATEPGKSAAEQYRAIRTGMLARWRQQRHLIHTITSATPQEGKTITSLNLGLSLAELRNRRTLVVEADLRLPQFDNLLSLDEGPGLVEVLEGQASYAEAIQTTAGGVLHVIPAGRRASNRAIQLLSSGATASLFKALRRDYDHIIIDTPPVVELADAGILGSLSDDVLLIVRMNRTPRTLIDQAIRTLDSYNAPVAGLIATDHPRHRERYYNYRYGYRYRYRDYAQAA